MYCTSVDGLADSRCPVLPALGFRYPWQYADQEGLRHNGWRTFFPEIGPDSVALEGACHCEVLKYAIIERLLVDLLREREVVLCTSYESDSLVSYVNGLFEKRSRSNE